MIELCCTSRESVEEARLIPYGVTGFDSPRIGDGWLRLTVLSVLSYAAVFLVRLAWVPGIAQLIRLVDRRPLQHDRREPFRVHAVIAWSGFRGVVSLAAALALPSTVSTGAELPDRDDIIAVTFVVILFTLFVQGGTFPAVLRRAHMVEDTKERSERALVETEPAKYALEHLNEDADALGTPEEARRRVREMLERELSSAGSNGADQARLLDAERRLRLKVVKRRRQCATKLRDQGRIDDSVLQAIQDQLDIDEVQLERSAPHPGETNASA